MHYDVRPRYTPGSPAQVGEVIAVRVADEERKGYAMTMDGIYGEEYRQRAQAYGLDGIVELVTEKADCWIVEDVITGHKFVRMFAAMHALLKPGQRERHAERLSKKYGGLPVREIADRITAPLPKRKGLVVGGVRIID